MKLTLLLVFALAIGPAVKAPMTVLVAQGVSFVCEAQGGCYVANEAGIDEMIADTLAMCHANGKEPK